MCGAWRSLRQANRLAKTGAPEGSLPRMLATKERHTASGVQSEECAQIAHPASNNQVRNPSGTKQYTGRDPSRAGFVHWPWIWCAAPVQSEPGVTNLVPLLPRPQGLDPSFPACPDTLRGGLFWPDFEGRTADPSGLPLPTIQIASPAKCA